MPREHYMTICTRGEDIVITYKATDVKNIEISCEQATNGGFNTLIVNNKFEILKNKGFNESDVSFLMNFIKRNMYVIQDECKEYFNA